MILPDNAFFELLRTVFGKIKTPFNKQILMNDLEKFLLRDDIKKNIASYINHSDALIIAAVAALNEPVPDDLETFFAGELNYTALHDLIVNLEERFIIYRFFEEEQNHRISRLALNPVLKSILSSIAADSSLLFPSISANEQITPDKPYVDSMRRTKGSRAHTPQSMYPETNTLPKQNTPSSQGGVVDDRILAALLSFVSRNKVFLRVGGGIRQKVGNMARTLFPGLPLETVVGGLQVLGLFFAEGETLIPDYRRFAAFGSLSRQERLAYCAAGILCYVDFQTSMSSGTFSPWLFRTKARNYAEAISHLYNSLDTERLYPHTTLRKLAYILGRADIKTNNVEIIDAMKKTGLLIPVSDKDWRKAPLTESSTEGVPVVMDTPFTFLVYPEIAYNDAISLAAFSDIIEAGITVRFELSRDSVVLAFNRGFSSVEIIELLQRLSHNRISENLLFTLRDWEKRHREVTLRRGLVLTLSPEQRHLAQTKPLAKFIVETLAPGVYMLSESAEEKAVQALSRAGVAIIGRSEECRSEDKDSVDEESSGGPLRHFFLPLHADRPPIYKIPPFSGTNGSSASILIESFHSILKQMRLGGEVRDELTARINRRLVLCESQLKDAVVRYEKLEARGLDYVGKAHIAKQAITMQAPVEVICPGRQKQEHVFGIPKALEKADGESILVIDPLGEEDTGTPGTLRIPLGKISLLRRIKKSIFEG